MCTTPQLLNEELEHLREALIRCKYPRWAINKVQTNTLTATGRQLATTTTKKKTYHKDLTIPGNAQKSGPPKDKPSTVCIVVPYVQGLGESFKNICYKYGVQTHFKGGTTIKQLLVRLKDQDPKEGKSNVIYSYQCAEVDCDEEYKGETFRTLGERYKEHLLKEPSAIHVHSIHTGYSATSDDFNIIGREDHDLTRLIKESIYIRVTNPTLNRNIGKFNLSHIWDRLHLNT